MTTVPSVRVALQRDGQAEFMCRVNVHVSGVYLFSCSIFVVAVANNNVRTLATKPSLYAIKTTVFTCTPATYMDRQIVHSSSGRLAMSQDTEPRA